LLLYNDIPRSEVYFSCITTEMQIRIEADVITQGWHRGEAFLFNISNADLVHSDIQSSPPVLHCPILSCHTLLSALHCIALSNITISTALYCTVHILAQLRRIIKAPED
jgi:hypothetical protein